MGKIIFVYGTTSGNTEWVVKSVSDAMKEAGNEITLQRVEGVKIDELNNYDLIVLASPTYGEGHLQEYFEPFYKDFVTKQFTNKKFASIALGDSKNYDVFCGAADILDEGIKKVGGVQIMPTLRIDGMVFGREEEWKTWGKTLASVLAK
ncbi:MAG: flavodoxin family protein [bacterium]